MTTPIKFIPYSLKVRVNTKNVPLKTLSPFHTFLFQAHIRKRNWSLGEKISWMPPSSFQLQREKRAGSGRNQMALGTRMPGYSLAESGVKTLLIGGKYLLSYKSRLVAGLFEAESEYALLMPI